jgi:hypothetical protein
MGTFFSPPGNPEIWIEVPDGYCPPEKNDQTKCGNIFSPTDDPEIWVEVPDGYCPSGINNPTK